MTEKKPTHPYLAIRPLYLAVFFSVYGLLLRFQHLAGRELWKDELIQLQNTVGKFQPIWERHTRGELTFFPGDYLLTYPFVQLFGDNKWGIAIPHMITTIIGFLMLYLIAKRYFKTWVGYAVSFAVLALNRELIFHSFEFRTYAVLPTLALITFYLMDDVVRRGNTLSLARRSFTGAFFIFTAGFHAYGILMIGLCLFFFTLQELAFRPLKSILRNIGLFMICGFAICTGVFCWYAIGTPSIATLYPTMSHLNTFEFIPNPTLNLFGFLKAIWGNLLGNKAFYLLLFALPVAIVLPHKNQFAITVFLLTLIILPIHLILKADLMIQYWFLQRQFIWLIPLAAFLLGWCWDTLFLKIKK